MTGHFTFLAAIITSLLAVISGITGLLLLWMPSQLRKLDFLDVSPKHAVPVCGLLPSFGC